MVGKLSFPSEIKFYLVFLFWGLGATFFALFLRDYSVLMPKGAVIGYHFFIALRVLKLLGFISALLIFHWLLERGYQQKLITLTIAISVLLCLYALYVYQAQLHNWIEINRNRMGTAGGEQPKVFSYLFHRAMGSFQEPSFLVEWLAVPFFLSLTISRSVLRILCAGFILGVAFLTGSMTGLVAYSVGLLVVVLFSEKKIESIKNIITSILLAISLFVAFVHVYTNTHGYYETTGYVKIAHKNIFEVVFHTVKDRITPLLEGGMIESNRAYVYEYLSSIDFSLTGSGLGVANLEFSNFLHSSNIASFLSLYINTLMSTGVVGIFLTGIALLFPLITFFQAKNNCSCFSIFLGAYISYLVMFSVNSEELTIPFALISALLIFNAKKSSQVKLS